MFEIPCIFCHFSTIRFPFKILDILGFLRRSLRSCTCTVTFMEMNILRTLQRLAATTKRFSGKQKFIKSRKTLYRKIIVEKHIFGKIADPQPAILSKK